jgi:hypothetical protein
MAAPAVISSATLLSPHPSLGAWQFSIRETHAREGEPPELRGGSKSNTSYHHKGGAH